MPNSRDYVWEKMYVAIGLMCWKGSLAERMSNATISALIRLNDDDLEGELGDDLRYVLQWTKHNHDGGAINKLPNDLELSRLTEKMLHIMLETHDTD